MKCHYNQFLILALLSAMLYTTQSTAYNYTFNNKTDHPIDAEVYIGVIGSPTKKGPVNIPAGESRTIVCDGWDIGACLVNLKIRSQKYPNAVQPLFSRGCGDMNFNVTYFQSGGSYSVGFGV